MPKNNSKPACVTVLFAFAAAFALPALAQFKGPGATAPATTVASILDHPQDDQHVSLRGHLVRQLSGDKYIFSDGTREIQVDIDRKHFPAQAIVPSTKVEIVGEVDKDVLKTAEIDVDSIRIID
jgi:uncharacterized protein (TIGR00156 family)